MSLISKVFVLLTRLSHSAMESTMTLVVLFVTCLASETKPLTDWLDPQLVLHNPTDHAQSKKTRKFLSSRRNHSSKVDSSSWRCVRMGLFFNNSCSGKWRSFLALLLRCLSKIPWKPLVVNTTLADPLKLWVSIEELKKKRDWQGKGNRESSFPSLTQSRLQLKSSSPNAGKSSVLYLSSAFTFLLKLDIIWWY